MKLFVDRLFHFRLSRLFQLVLREQEALGLRQVVRDLRQLLLLALSRSFVLGFLVRHLHLLIPDGLAQLRLLALRALHLGLHARDLRAELVRLLLRALRAVVRRHLLLRALRPTPGALLMRTAEKWLQAGRQKVSKTIVVPL